MTALVAAAWPLLLVSAYAEPTEAPLTAAPPAHAAAPLTLAEALALAEGRSPVIAVEDAELAAARRRSAAALGRLGPRAELTAGYTRQSYVEPATIELDLDLPGVEPAPVELGEAVEDRWSFRVSIEQPVLGGGANATWRADRATVAARAARRDEATQDVRLLVTERWLALDAAEETVALAEAAHAAVAAHLVAVEARAGVGTATAAEVAEARAVLAEADAGRVAARGQLAAARVALASLVGLALDAPIEAAGTPVGGVPAAPEDGATSPAEAAASAAVRAARARADAAAAAPWPRLLLRAGYQYENPNSRYFPIESTWNDSWDASVVLTWTLDSGVAWNEAGAARAVASSAEASRRAVAEAVTLRAAQAAEAVRTAEASRTAAEARHAAARQARDAVVAAFTVGAATSSDVLDREADLARARAAHVSAHLALHAARARLAHAHGAL